MTDPTNDNPLVLQERLGDGPLQCGLLRLNRPAQRNALNDALMEQLGAALIDMDSDPGIGCIVLTGNDKAFAAGADIASMADYKAMDAHMGHFVTRNWETIRRIRKPIIGAIAGHCLGGGNELAMMCDILIAADTAKFGQPETRLGVIPGAGGTVRLPLTVGKYKAMDMILTGRMMDAAEAERAGLVSRVVPAAELIATATAIAAEICKLSLPSILMAKECVNQSFEGPLSAGVAYERRSFHMLFGSEDQREGMQAFLEKRSPNWKHR